MAFDKTAQLLALDKAGTQQGSQEQLAPIVKALITDYQPNTKHALIADLDPATATTAQIATAVNAILNALRANGLVSAT